MPLTEGNAAKVYCINLIDDMAAAGKVSSILDLGCGDARNFPPLLRKHAHLRYVGVEPSQRACAEASRALSGLPAEIVNDLAYDVRRGPFDVVVSFSVLEHVYRRRRYLEAVKENLGRDGLVLINYDAGHFVSVDHAGRHRVELWKSRLGKLLARFGHEGHYQAFVREADFRSLVEDVGLRIVEEKAFNTDLKRVHRVVPSARRSDFTERWLAFELYLNTLGIEYHDGLASVFRTRNFVLAHA
jgi:SAM-dependent methyltransferase